jgi:uncharacterized protein YaaN involved in tellurite resistance
MEKIKNDLRKALSKQELLEALEDSFKLQEELYDGNLDRMAQLHQQIEAIKENNTSISNRMKELVDKIRGLKEND